MSNTTQAKDVTEGSNETDLMEIINPYLHKWYWFVLSAIAAVILAVALIKFTEPVYNVQTSFLVKDAKKMSSAAGDFGVLQGLTGIGGMATNSIENELEIFKSKQIIEKVAKVINLQTPLYGDGFFFDQELYGAASPILISVINQKPYVDLPEEPIYLKVNGDKLTLSSEELKADIVTTYNKTISLPYANIMIRKNPDYNKLKAEKELDDYDGMYFEYNGFAETVNDYQKALSVELLDKDATVIGLSMEYPNVDKAKDILNNLVQLYNSDAINDKNSESKKSVDFIDERINLISQELGEVESEKERFKLQNNIVDIPTEARISLQNSNTARLQSVQADAQIELTNILLGYINSQGNSETLPANIGLDNEAASMAISQYNALVLQRNQLLENATPQNPLVIEKNEQIQNLKRAIREGLNKNRTQLTLMKNSAEQEIARNNADMMKVPAQEKMFRSIERQQTIKENLYLILLEKREEAAIALAITADKARVIDYAYPSEKPVSPKKLMILAGFLTLSFLIPFAYIFLKNLLNNTVATRHDIEKLSHVNVAGEIPAMTKTDTDPINYNDITPMAEAFRILVTNLKFLAHNRGGSRVIMVASSVKGEGKTFVSVNLAVALGNMKTRVLVIGSDIRNPQLQRYVSIGKSERGVTDFLVGEVEHVDEIIHSKVFSPYVDVIYSGSIPPNPTDLLENGRYEEMLEQVKAKYDYVILDSAPLMLVTDSYLYSEYADATLYVVRSEVSEKKFIEYASRAVESGRLQHTAFVLNDVDRRKLGYANKYGYGYHAEEQTLWQRIKSRFS